MLWRWLTEPQPPDFVRRVFYVAWGWLLMVIVGSVWPDVPGLAPMLWLGWTAVVGLWMVRRMRRAPAERRPSRDEFAFLPILAAVILLWISLPSGTNRTLVCGAYWVVACGLHGAARRNGVRRSPEPGAPAPAPPASAGS